MIVIGGGAGGLAAARAGARRRARTLLVEAGVALGGECTFTGCVPSKALIAAAGAGHTFDQAMSSVRRAVGTIAATETDEVLAGEGVEVLHGRATLRSANDVDVDGRRLRGGRLVLATGSAPAVPPIAGLDTVPYLTNENVFDLDHLPGSLAVLGGGAIGCELAQAFARLNTHVTIIEALDRLLPKEEPEASAVISEVLAAEGIVVHVGRSVTRAEVLGEAAAIRLQLDNGETITADRLLVAVGRRATTDELGLDAAGVATEGGYIVTDDHLASSAPGIWAAGDVTGKLQFTHAADQMGRIAAGNALSPRWRKRRFDPAAIPRVTYTSPEVASVGVTEAQAAERGARVAELPMTSVDRAIVTGETRGFVKLLVGPRPVLRSLAGGRVLGATIVASRAGEMIHEPVLAMRTRMFPARLALTVHAYPTWSTAIQQAAAQLFVDVDGRRARPARRQS